MGTMVARGHDEPRGGRCTILVVVEAIQAIDAKGHFRNTVTFKEKFRHHLSDVKRGARRLSKHDGMVDAALQERQL